jgi:hypothetical protein
MRAPMSDYTPALRIVEDTERVRLCLAGCVWATGPTLQDAADELVRKMLLLAMEVRSGGLSFSSECPTDSKLFAFVWELGEICAAGGDIRGRLFDPDAHVADSA